jgi:hypothetical protein
MKKSTIVFFVFCAVVMFFFVKALFTPALTPDQIYREPSLTPTINYYQEDLYAQCKGLESFKELLEKYPSLKINGNYKKDYQRILDNIERDKKMLGLDNFKCP